MFRHPVRVGLAVALAVLIAVSASKGTHVESMGNPDGATNPTRGLG